MSREPELISHSLFQMSTFSRPKRTSLTPAGTCTSYARLPSPPNITGISRTMTTMDVPSLSTDTCITDIALWPQKPVILTVVDVRPCISSALRRWVIFDSSTKECCHIYSATNPARAKATDTATNRMAIRFRFKTRHSVETPPLIAAKRNAHIATASSAYIEWPKFYTGLSLWT